jgi:hypothetical protein
MSDTESKHEDATPYVGPVEVEKPPDGGWQAWFMVFGVHLTIFNTWYAFCLLLRVQLRLVY